MKNIRAWILFISAGLLLLLASPYILVRWDLSEEKKFTLSESTISTLQALDGPIRIKVYLAGKDLPGGFKRLQKASFAILQDIQRSSPQTISIETIDLYEAYPDASLREQQIFQLDSLGLPPTNLVNNEGGKQVQQMVFPGLVIEKGDKKTGVLLLKGNQLASSQEVLNQSVEGLEYEIMQGIQSLMDTARKKIGFFLDYSRVPAIKQLGLIASLRKSYDLYPVDLSASSTLVGLDAICVIQPDRKFSPTDQFKIDQFLVKGGKGIFFLEGVRVDTIQGQGLVSSPMDVGLEEMLYRYGLRLNANWVKDAQLSGMIPLEVGNFGNKANLQLMPWPAFPLLTGNPASVITKNLDAIYGKFVSSIDTVSGSSGLKKTPLLVTSAYTQAQKAPATLPFASSGKGFNPAQYTSGPQVISYLLEGQFKSIFANRPLPQDSLANGFVAQGQQAGGLIVVGDGDLALNGIDPNTKGPMPLGFDPFAKHTFANRDFILNAFHYLLDDQKALLARNKNIRLRPLDKVKVQEGRSYYQFLNVLVPVGFGILISLLVILYRKRKYGA
ncbi:gliding motility-associated ABC transporter substrate-binding protein GldG [Aquirufa sp. LEPPI-3A]|uniref:gliding motility-associated ABC transporter substrate-binding protein GldG n=1 Tax=Aquirufa regiilacus TaxID=3024868 RepID=UPI0028DD60C5|nr:gliding motility-associated ABC transporter substrate-binding protein GldG [Aquirufa sp. LEPPI-3A]MDT8887920.1 gliding motility-associated ABC transporter substrate-binding protein GldG [Aquirufa sp. LEPPI-3A]